MLSLRNVGRKRSYRKSIISNVYELLYLVTLPCIGTIVSLPLSLARVEFDQMHAHESLLLAHFQAQIVVQNMQESVAQLGNTHSQCIHVFIWPNTRPRCLEWPKISFVASLQHIEVQYYDSNLGLVSSSR